MPVQYFERLPLLACIIGMLASAGLLGASRLSHVWLPFDMLSHFTLHFAILTVAFAVGCFIPFAPVLTAILLALVSFASIGLYAHYVSENSRIISTPQAGEKQLRLMTFNTQIRNNDIKAIAAEIRRLDPDVAMLVEFGETKRIIFDLLKERFAYRADCGAGCQFAFLSKVPIFISEAKSGWEGPRLVRAELGGGFSGLAIIGVHMIRPPHIAIQFRQIAALANYLKQISGELIVMGDFNATPFSRLLIDFSDRTNLRRLTSMPSWPSHFEMPQLAIDHIFASPQIRLLEGARIGRRSGSDHYPVTVTVAVRAFSIASSAPNN
jgi:endonuclease/exonuclease/phosphatase (EEP) superfamily protein YafD